MPEFHRKNIRLPAERYIGHQWYFLTLVTQGRIKRFENAHLVSETLQCLLTHALDRKFAIPAYCFMPDHLHILVSGTAHDSNLKRFIEGFKQVSAYRFKQQTGERLWQKKYFDHILRSKERWESVATYIWSNPVRQGLCKRSEEWQFSGSSTFDWRRLMAAGMEPWAPPWKQT